MTHTPRHARRGFTLVEVLLVVAILSGILVTIAQVLTAARTSRDTIHNLRETQLAGPAILDLLEHDLRGIWTFNLPDEHTLSVVDRVEVGLDADRIDFVTTTNSLVLTPGATRFLRADVNEVGYCLRPNPDDNDFLELYRREDFGVDEEPFRGGSFTFLHDRVVAFDVRVYEEDGPDAEELSSWGSSYDEHTGLPARIEIDLSLELAPRLNREQLSIAPIRQRNVTHRRVIRFPEHLREAQRLRPRPEIPEITPPVLQSGAGQAGGPLAGQEGGDRGGGGPTEAVEPLDLGGGDSGGGGGNPFSGLGGG